MKTKYLILIFFGFILNKINAVTCEDIDRELDKLRVNNNKIVILNNSTNKIIFFFINNKLYTLITNIGVYVYYSFCLDNILTFVNIEKDSVDYNLALDRDKSSIVTATLPIDNDGSEVKTNRYESVINSLNSIYGVKEYIYKVDQIKPLLNSRVKTFLHNSEDDLLSMDHYYPNMGFSADFFDREDEGSDKEQSDSPPKRMRMTDEFGSNILHGYFESTSKTNGSDGRTSHVIDEELQPQNKVEVGSVARGEANTEPSISSQIVTQSSGAEAVGSNLQETRFNEKIESNDVVKIKGISANNKKAIKKIIKNLEDNQSIKLIPGPDVQKRKYSEIIFKPSGELYGTISYKVTTVDTHGKKKDYQDQLLEIVQEKDLLRIRFSLRQNKKIIDVNNDSKKRYTVFSLLNGLYLHILTDPNPGKKIKGTIIDHSQEITYLNQKYSKNFVSIIDDIQLDHKQRISDLIQGLEPDERLIFIDNIPFSRKNSEVVRKIEVVKTAKINIPYHYDIDIDIDKPQKTETVPFKDRTILTTTHKGNLILSLRTFSKGKLVAKIIKIENFDLFSSEKK